MPNLLMTRTAARTSRDVSSFTNGSSTSTTPGTSTNGAPTTTTSSTAPQQPADLLRQYFMSYEGIHLLKRFIEAQRDEQLATFGANLITKVPTKPTATTVVALANDVAADAAAFATQRDAFQTTIQSLHIALEWMNEQIAEQSQLCGADAVCVIDDMIAGTRDEAYSFEIRRDERDHRVVELERLRASCVQGYSNGSNGSATTDSQSSVTTKGPVYATRVGHNEVHSEPMVAEPQDTVLASELSKAKRRHT